MLSHEQFFHAARYGDLETVKSILENKNISIDPNMMFDNHVTILYTAVVNGNLKIVEYLLQNKMITIDLLCTENNYSLLQAAIMGKDVEMVKLLLTSDRVKATINQKTLTTGYTVLHYAAQYNSPESIKLLLAAGADWNIKSINLATPLDIAFELQYSEICELLDGSHQKLHKAIIQRMQALGYKSNHDGICYGFAQVAKLMALAGREVLNKFYKTIYIVAKLKVKDLLLLKKKHDDLLKQAQSNALEALDCSENELTTAQKKQFNQLISENLNLARKKMTDQEKIQEENYLDIISLFDAIELEFQGCDDYNYLFGARIRNQSANPIIFTPLIQPHQLEKKSGEFVHTHFTGCYTKKEFPDFFSSLRKRLQAKNPGSGLVALTLGATHCITIIYDIPEDHWIILDINILSSELEELINHKLPGIVDISNTIAKCMFSKTGDVIFETVVSSDLLSASKLQSSLQLWKKDLAPLLAVTPQKAAMLNQNQPGWLYMAAEADETQTVKALLANRANVNGHQCYIPLTVAAESNSLNTIKILLECKDAMINIQSKRGRTALFTAAACGYTSIVKLLLEKKANPNLSTYGGSTPIIVAAQRGYTDIVELLLDCDNISLKPDYEDTSAVLFASQNGHVNTLKAIFKKKSLEIDINHVNEKNYSALFLAAFNGQLDVIKILLNTRFKTNININLESTLVATALYGACQNGFDNIVDLLIKAGVDHSLLFENEYSVAYIAASNGHTKVIRLLAAAKADLSRPLKVGVTPLHIAAIHGYHEIISIIINDKVDLNFSDRDGNTALHHAVNNLNRKSATLLIEAKAEILLNLKGESPVHIAASHNDDTMLKMLIDLKVDINIADRFGQTALHIAAMKNDVELLNFLIQSKASLTMVDMDNHPPIFTATKQGSLKTLQTLLDLKCDVNTKIYRRSLTEIAVKHNQIEALQLLMTYKADTSYVDECGRNLLQLAVIMGHTNMLRFLMSNIKPLNLDYQDKNGQTAISMAAELNDLDIIEILVHAKANIDICNHKGDSPIHYAIFWDSIDAIKKLIQLNANLQLINTCGNKSIHLACVLKKIEIVKILVDSKADINERNKNMSTPLLSTLYAKQEAIALYLLDKKANINLYATQHYTPFYSAAQNGMLVIIKSLLIHPEVSIDSPIEADKDVLLKKAKANNRFEEVNTLFNQKKLGDRFKGFHALHAVAFFNHFEIAKLLIGNGIKINDMTEGNLSALDYARIMGNTKIVNLLQSTDQVLKFKHDNLTATFKKLCNIEFTPESEMSTLKLAHEFLDIFVKNQLPKKKNHDKSVNAFHDSVEILGRIEPKFLNAINFQGNTLCIQAVEANSIKIINKLMEFRADFNKPNSDGLTPLRIAIDKKHNALIPVLKKGGANINTLCNNFSYVHVAAERGDAAIIKILCEEKADPNLKSATGWSPIHVASECGKTSAVSMLLECKAILDIEGPYGMQAIHLVMRSNNAETLECLIKAKANINSFNYGGETPTHLAVLNNKIDFLKLLHKTKIDLSLIKSKPLGLSPLHLAIKNECFDSIALFIECSMNFCVKDDAGKIPIDYANENIKAFILIQTLKGMIEKNLWHRKYDLAKKHLGIIKKYKLKNNWIEMLNDLFKSTAQDNNASFFSYFFKKNIKNDYLELFKERRSFAINMLKDFRTSNNDKTQNFIS